MDAELQELAHRVELDPHDHAAVVALDAVLDRLGRTRNDRLELHAAEQAKKLSLCQIHIGCFSEAVSAAYIAWNRPIDVFTKSKLSNYRNSPVTQQCSATFLVCEKHANAVREAVRHLDALCVPVLYLGLGYLVEVTIEFRQELPGFQMMVGRRRKHDPDDDNEEGIPEGDTEQA